MQGKGHKRGLFRNILADSRLRAHQVLWNQWVYNNSFPQETRGGVALSRANNIITFDGSATATTNITGWLGIDRGTIPANNKVLLKIHKVSGSINDNLWLRFKLDNSSSGTASYATLTNSTIITTASDYSSYVTYLYNTVLENLQVQFAAYNLTQMFGPGNEPSDLTIIESIFNQLWSDNPDGQYAYNRSGTVMWYYA